MINLIELAPSARWQGSQLVGEDSGRDASYIEWNGSSADARGFVRLLDSAQCEDGHTYTVLQTHPKWVSRGTIKGWLPWDRIPNNSVFLTEVGFLDGADGTDGVTFQVWEHHNAGGRHVWNRIINYHKVLNGRIISLEADLSHLSGQEVGIELRVDAGRSSGRDWAVWINPHIDSREGHRGQAWSFRPTSLTVHERNETRRIEGRGDEPYLGVIYFRSIFGQPGSTKVAVLEELRTLGNNVRSGQTVRIPDDAELTVADVGIQWDELRLDVGLMGYQIVAMEADRRGKREVRNKLNELGNRLSDALRENVEGDRIGILSPHDVQQRIRTAVFGSDEGRRPVRDFFSRAVRWLFRADDLIGTNLITVVGIDPSALPDDMRDAFTPTSTTDPVSSLVEQDFNLEFVGSGARYGLRVELRRSDTAILVR